MIETPVKQKERRDGFTKQGENRKKEEKKDKMTGMRELQEENDEREWGQ